MSDERTTKDKVEYIANKFAENPGHFAATILRMYWDMEKERDQYKEENEQLRKQFDYMNQSYMKLYEENEKLKEENEKLKDKLKD